MDKVQYLMDSKIGALYLVTSAEALHGIYWRQQAVPLVKSLDSSGKAIKILKETIRQLSEYFEGRRTEFDLPLAVKGTEFQERVWRELRKIPYGKTLSYSDIAKKIRKDKAVRAVGTANGRNPISIIVPCHRVIAADGTLGGYAGGLEIKTKLLELEKRCLAPNAGALSQLT